MSSDLHVNKSFIVIYFYWFYICRTSNTRQTAKRKVNFEEATEDEGTDGILFYPQLS